MRLRRNWERRNSDIIFQAINQEFESQRFQLHQSSLYGELELRRVCCEETCRARQARSEELIDGSNSGLTEQSEWVLIIGNVFERPTAQEGLSSTIFFICVVREETDKKAADIRARLIMTRTLEEIGKECQAEGEAKVSHEKPKLDNACKLRGIYFIDPEDKEFKETIKNARNKLETSVAPAMPCKLWGRIVGVVHPIKWKTSKICVDSGSWWIYETACGKFDTALSSRPYCRKGKPIHHSITIWYTKFIPMPQAMKIPAAQAAVDKEWEHLEKISAWYLTKVKSKKSVIDEARTSGATVHFASLIDIWHLKNAELEAKHQKYKGRVVLRGDIVKDDSGSYAVFTEQGSSASQMPRSWISSPDCRVAMDKQQTQYQLIPKWKWKMLTNNWKFQNRNVQTFGFVYHDTNGQNHGPLWKIQSFVLKGNCMVILWQDYYGKGILRRSYWSMVGRKIQIGNVSLYIVKKDYSYLCMWMTSNWLERKHCSDVESTQQRSRFGRTNIFPWSCILGMHSSTMPKKQRYCGQSQNHVRAANFSGE